MDQPMVRPIVQHDPRLLLISGHYEGIDERVRQGWIDEEISVGDYILSNGTLPALTMIDAIVRLIPGVWGTMHRLDPIPLREKAFWKDLSTPAQRSFAGSRCRMSCFPVTMRRSRRGVRNRPWSGRGPDARIYLEEKNRQNRRFPRRNQHELKGHRSD